MYLKVNYINILNNNRYAYLSIFYMRSNTIIDISNILMPNVK